MDFTAPTHDPRIKTRLTPRSSNTLAILEDSIEDLQLHRLAGAVLSKSPADMAALSEANPDLFWEWIEAFALKKREADAECRLWSAAIACLATATAADGGPTKPRATAAAE
ncbi:MAG: hypothetical protein ABL894_12430 [Hyphomicrobium sp.]